MNTLILGTAGHIDHGKTALVRALTGTDTDRLPEEKQRGITIDLGFAQLQLQDLAIGIVDVPGHEDFIRNMLAGATGLDAVLLIIAADEGVMPQTREHLAILDLLNIRNGIAVVTKRDLVDDEWLSLVCDDVRTTLAGTSLGDAPVVAVSSKSGAGLDGLRSTIYQRLSGGNARSSDDIFRMPVDRTFTVRGTGTVVTGTVWSGRIAADSNVMVLPAAARARVRGVQVHGVAVPEAAAGQRSAIALSGVERDAVGRGDVVVSSAHWHAVHMLTVRARIIASSEWLLQPRQRVRVHAGTAEVLARAVLLDADVLSAGEQGWVQLRLEAPVVARVGDRVVIRSYSPVTTIGGGVVVEVGGRKRSSMDPASERNFEEIISSDEARSVRAALKAADSRGASDGELTVHTPHGPAAIARALRAIAADAVQVGERWYARDIVERITSDVIAAADELHRTNPLRSTLDRAQLRARVHGAEPELVDYAIGCAIERGELTGAGSAIRRPSHIAQLSVRQQAVLDAVRNILKESGLAPPLVAELAVSTGNSADLEALLRLLVEQGDAVQVAPDLYMDAAALAEASQRLRTQLAQSQALTAADFRAVLPVSRKHLIPLLEYFDRIGVTRRIGDLRTVQASETA